MIRVLRKKHTSPFAGLGIQEYNMISVSLFNIILVVSETIKIPDQLKKKLWEDNSHDISDYLDCSTGYPYRIQDNDRILILKKPYIIWGSKLENSLQQIINQIQNYNNNEKEII